MIDIRQEALSLETFLVDLLARFKTKNEGYTQGDDSIFGNFVRGSTMICQKPMPYLLALMTKHVDRLYEEVIAREGKRFERDQALVDEVAGDIILYTALLRTWYCMNHSEPVQF